MTEPTLKKRSGPIADTETVTTTTKVVTTEVDDGIQVDIRKSRRYTGDDSPDMGDNGVSREITLGRLVALIFFQTCGGPFGIEQTVSAGGPFLAILQALVLPIIFNLPIALTTSEMSTSMPHDGGLVVWAHKCGFGHFWAFQVSWWYLAMGVISNSALPNQLTDYLNVVVPGVKHQYKFVVHGVTVLASLLLNLRGARAVGSVSVVASFLLLIPFILLVLLGLPHIQPSVFVAAPHPQSWTYFLAVALWSQGGWDGVSMLSGEIKNIGKVFMPAMMASLVIVGFTYFLPLFVGVGIMHDDISLWKDGYFAQVAQHAVQISLGGTGHWMLVWMSIAGMISAFGLLAGSLCTASRSLYACAKIGLMPKPFAWIHAPTHVPWFSLMFQAICIMFVSPFFNFASLVRLNIALYCVDILFSFAVFYHLRRHDPGLPRPYRVPVSVNTAMLLLLPCIFLCIAYIGLMDGMALVVFIIVMLAGPLLFYTVLAIHKRTTWFLPLNHIDILDNSTTVSAADTTASSSTTMSESEPLLSGDRHSDVLVE